MKTDRITCFRSWQVAVCLVGMVLPFPAAAFTLEGPARAVNAHTVVVHGTHVVLLGIRPIGVDDSCGLDNAPWPCGDRAQVALQRLAGAGPVTCDLVAKIGHGDFQGTCTIPGGQDLAAALVAEGWARAADERYQADDAAAQKNKRGAWGLRPPVGK